MANRSYLYSIDFDRTKGERKKGEKIHGLSEYPYSIPLSYKILVSQEPKISHSIIWDYEHPITIQGNFEKGKRKLLIFLDNLQNENIFNKEELEEQITETKRFLTKHGLENIILECKEIYEMGNRELEDQNEELFEQEILNIESLINEYLHEFKNMKLTIEKINLEINDLTNPKSFISKLLPINNSSKIQELEKKINKIRQEMWNMLGVNYWDDLLYFQFANE